MAKTYILYIFLIALVVTRVYLFCNKVEECYSSSTPTSSDKVVKIQNYFDQKSRIYFPSPQSELLLGMTIGANFLTRLSRFNDMLKRSGTIHVAVVSGFNINLVFNFLIRILGSKYKLKNYLISIIVTFCYALISGFEPPVVRSWIMGTVLAYGNLYGRKFAPFYVLILSAVIMVLVNPTYIFSLSFQLSFLATLGLILYSEPLKGQISKFISAKVFFFEDLVSSLAAQVLVWPLISYRFGTVSLISPLSNALLLWTIPISTILVFIVAFLSKKNVR